MKSIIKLFSSTLLVFVVAFLFNTEKAAALDYKDARCVYKHGEYTSLQTILGNYKTDMLGYATNNSQYAKVWYSAVKIKASDTEVDQYKLDLVGSEVTDNSIMGEGYDHSTGLAMFQIGNYKLNVDGKTYAGTEKWSINASDPDLIPINVRRNFLDYGFWRKNNPNAGPCPPYIVKYTVHYYSAGTDNNYTWFAANYSDAADLFYAIKNKIIGDRYNTTPAIVNLNDYQPTSDQPFSVYNFAPNTLNVWKPGSDMKDILKEPLKIYASSMRWSGTNSVFSLDILPLVTDEGVKTKLDSSEKSYYQAYFKAVDEKIAGYQEDMIKYFLEDTKFKYGVFDENINDLLNDITSHSSHICEREGSKLYPACRYKYAKLYWTYANILAEISNLADRKDLPKDIQTEMNKWDIITKEDNDKDDIALDYAAFNMQDLLFVSKKAGYYSVMLGKYVDNLHAKHIEELKAQADSICADPPSGKGKDSDECKVAKEAIGAAEDKQEEAKTTTIDNLKEAGVGNNFITGLLGMTVSKGNPLTCEDFLFFDKSSQKTYDVIKTSLTILQIIGPILAMIFGVLDFAKATLASDNDALQKAGKDFSKRLIAAALLVILPIILKVILNIAVANGILGENLPMCF